MILLIDNYDSFVHNLARYFKRLGRTTHVVRNTAIDAARVRDMQPEAILLSPGPCTPQKAGCSLEMVRALHAEIPILGVCLGHQCIGEAFGGTVAGASRIMHGKTSQVTHEETDLYRGMKQPFPAGRYHSLAVMQPELPPELVVDARSDDDEIMGVHHRDYPIYGVQFHPESVLTPGGKRLLRNFLRIVDSHSEKETES